MYHYAQVERRGQAPGTSALSSEERAETPRPGALPRAVGVHHVSVAHDDWRGICQGARCNCNPDIRLQWSQPTAAQH
jgi:hypothetical protein